MLDFNEHIQTGLPKLPEDYWQKSKTSDIVQPEINIFDNNLKTSIKDISIFNKKEP